MIIRIRPGSTFTTPDGYLIIRGEHGSDFQIDEYEIDEDGNETKTRAKYISRHDLKQTIKETMHKTVDMLIYEEDQNA